MNIKLNLFIYGKFTEGRKKNLENLIDNLMFEVFLDQIKYRAYGWEIGKSCEEKYDIIGDPKNLKIVNDGVKRIRDLMKNGEISYKKKGISGAVIEQIDVYLIDDNGDFVELL